MFQSDLCSGSDFSEKESVSASSSTEYINVMETDELQGLLTPETENEGHESVSYAAFANTCTEEHQAESAGLTATSVRCPLADKICAAALNSVSLPAQSSSSPRKLVALPSEATVMVNGQKCVLRVGNVGRLTACPVATDSAVTSVSVSTRRLQGYLKSRPVIETRHKPVVLPVEEREMRDCSLDISCNTMTQSVSSPSDPDHNSNTSSDAAMMVLNAAEPEAGELLSDSSTVSVCNSPSTASAPGSWELQTDASSRQHTPVVMADNSDECCQMENKVAVTKDVDTDRGLSQSSVDQRSGVNTTDVSSKDQLVISASNRVQNYLAGLGLPVKRGRGRPRRKPLTAEELSSVMVSDGNSSVPLLDSGLKSSLSLLLSNVAEPTPGEKHTSIIIEQEDGTEKHIILATTSSNKHQTASTEDEGCRGDNTFHSHGTDGLTDAMHLVMVPKKEPVKIAVRASDVNLKKLKCQKCEYQGLHEHELQKHLSDVHADRLTDLVRCRCCSFLFFTDDDLKEHFQKNHPKNMCNDCGFMSEHMYVIRRHVQRHSIAGCECHICGRRYKDQYILKMHVKMRHMEPEVLFQCVLCSKLFTRKAHLKRHLRIHNPDKPYQCPHCDYRGCERSDITKHVLVHNQPQHTCEMCGKSFRHIKNKELHLKRHRGQRDYKCVFCEFYGYTYTDIRKHQERKHARHSLLCGRCCMTFKSEHLLQVHQQTECHEMTTASDSEANDSSDVMQYVTDSSQLPADDSRLVSSVVTSEPTPSSSAYEAFVSGELNLLEVQMEDGDNELINCDSNIGLVSPTAAEVPLVQLLNH